LAIKRPQSVMPPRAQPHGRPCELRYARWALASAAPSP
jgi:hypothetical protein